MDDDTARRLYQHRMAIEFHENVKALCPSLTEGETEVLQGIGVNLITTIINDMGVHYKHE